jgi:hypothetical protein
VKRWLASFVVLAAAVAVVVSQAAAHIERASYWPDPAADTAVSPPTGGKVPDARSLFSALRKPPPGRTHVVCQGTVPSRAGMKAAKRAFRKARTKERKRAFKAARRDYRAGVRANASMQALAQGLKKARAEGYKLRPTEQPRKVSKRQARRLRRFNGRLLARCRYDSIQDAATAAGNNDRIVIMPGLYTEPKSRAKPTNDPACADLKQENDEGSSAAVSYAYHLECPNDQNLIAVMGRALGPGTDPQPPLWERRNIPNTGPCIRCNVQMEGSGVSPDDVVIDAGRVESGNKGPHEAKKDVTIRVDRADGFVIRNVTVRHAREHNIYILESDGYRAERFKSYWPGDYGILTFVEDHGLIQDCDSAGAGDSGIYPGASADVGEQTAEAQRRYGQEIRFCDSHHNASGVSGTTGNAVHIHDNDFYDNALGLTTDVFTASGHPGFPTDSMLIENNNFYSNNFNPYAEGSDVRPVVPFPVGTGMWIAGGNNHTVRNNRFWDNWRRGTMLFSVPDAFVCPGAEGNSQAGCDPSQVSTSHRNRHYDNVMGRDPNGKVDPNGTDFWWDEFANNVNNCWYGNTGTDGTAASVTSDPGSLPSNCETSRGTGNPAHDAELLACLAAFTFDVESCDWFTTPREPQP